MAYPEETESESEDWEVPKEEAAVKTWSTEQVVRGLTFSSKAMRTAKGTDPGKLWILEEVGSLLQKDNSPCRGGTAQWKCREKSDQGQCGTRSPKRMRRDCGRARNAKFE
jgi:hypothetical protein